MSIEGSQGNFEKTATTETTQRQTSSQEDYGARVEASKDILKESKLSEIYETLRDNYGNTELDTVTRESITQLLKEHTGNNISSSIVDRIIAEYKMLSTDWSEESFIKSIKNFINSKDVEQQGSEQEQQERKQEQQERKQEQKSQKGTEEETEKEKKAIIVSNNVSAINELLKDSSNDVARGISEEAKKLSDRLDKGEDPEIINKELTQIIEELKNKETFEAVATELYEQSPKKYETFISTLKSIDSSFGDMGNVFESRLKLALGNDTLDNTNITGNKITQNSPDGYITTATLNGENRTLGRPDSKYRVNSTLENDKQVQNEVNEIEYALSERITPITKKLQSLDSIRKYLETANAQNIELNEAKKSIKDSYPELYVEFSLENINTYSDIIRIIESQTEKLKKEKDDMELKAKRDLDNLTRKHKQELAEKQEIQKQILNFLREIGFDRISQSITNKIIEKISFVPMNYGLQKEINFEEGSLGFDKDNGDRNISELEKKEFIKLYNRMLTGSTEYPVRLNNGIITYFSTLENARANKSTKFVLGIGGFISEKLGANPMDRIMNNLNMKEGINLNFQSI